LCSCLLLHCVSCLRHKHLARYLLGSGGWRSALAFRSFIKL
jgi:hypothetical protein